MRSSFFPRQQRDQTAMKIEILAMSRERICEFLRPFTAPNLRLCYAKKTPTIWSHCSTKVRIRHGKKLHQESLPLFLLPSPLCVSSTDRCDGAWSSFSPTDDLVCIITPPLRLVTSFSLFFLVLPPPRPPPRDHTRNRLLLLRWGPSRSPMKLGLTNEAKGVASSRAEKERDCIKKEGDPPKKMSFRTPPYPLHPLPLLHIQDFFFGGGGGEGEGWFS